MQGLTLDPAAAIVPQCNFCRVQLFMNTWPRRRMLLPLLDLWSLSATRHAHTTDQREMEPNSKQRQQAANTDRAVTAALAPAGAGSGGILHRKAGGFRVGCVASFESPQLESRARQDAGPHERRLGPFREQLD